ncbi:PROTEIN EXORDIUM-LIKE 5 [Salix viminalis]|uniref:PROTEIN EXORDIUM-LIKE 5 n=1 Tax=Salix viminalis TaxID=40686 RepID=A0A9Q0NLE5_SALVM|nr:PROTEIN EXORDIUM-LIKE 5 [Salix viminalis]
MALSISHASVLFTATVLTLLLAPTPTSCWRPWPHLKPNSSDLLYDSSKKYEGFIGICSPALSHGPSADREHNSPHNLGRRRTTGFIPTGSPLTRLSIQSVIKSAVTAKSKPLPTNPRNGLYLLLTSADVYVQDFCGQVTVRSSVLACVPIHFLCPKYIPGLKALKSPNSDVGVDGMISVIAHEIAELATNPLVNAWYAGQDPSSPVEIADLCEGIYGTGGGGSYTGQMLMDHDGSTFNMHGIRRKYLVQWVWNHFKNYCSGPNALDQ